MDREKQRYTASVYQSQSKSLERTHCAIQAKGMANLLRLIVRVDSGYGVAVWEEDVDVAPTGPPVSAASAPFFFGIAILLEE